MDPLDPISQTTVVGGLKPLLTLGLFAAIGSFFFGALFTAVRRRIQENGWFNTTTREQD